LAACESITGSANVTLTDPPSVTLNPGIRNWALCLDIDQGRVALKTYRLSRTLAGTGIVAGALTGAALSGANPVVTGLGAAGGAATDIAALFGSGEDPVPTCAEVFGAPLASPATSTAVADPLARAMAELRDEEAGRPSIAHARARAVT